MRNYAILYSLCVMRYSMPVTRVAPPAGVPVRPPLTGLRALTAADSFWLALRSHNIHFLSYTNYEYKDQ